MNAMDFEPWLIGSVLSAAVTLGGIGAAPIQAKIDASTPETFAATCRRAAWAVVILAVCGMAISTQLTGAVGLWLWPLAKTTAIGAIALYVAAFTARVLIARFVLPGVSGWMRAHRISQSTDALADIRTEQARYAPKSYDPSAHFVAPHTTSPPGLFLGLDDRSKPMYLPWPVFRETHLQIIGPTRFGKGVVAGCILAQSIRAGFGSWYFDPKGDNHIPKIMAEQAKAAGRPFVILDLVNNIGAYAPFAGGSLQDRIGRIVQAFKLEDTGSDGDYYKRSERKMIRLALERVPADDATLANILKAYQQVKFQELGGDERRVAQETSVESGLAEWAGIANISGNGRAGLQVKEALDQNAVVYVRCSTMGLARDVARILITELAETALKNPPAADGRHAFMLVDEARSMISSPLVSALTTVAGAGLTVGLAYQSILDMRNMDDKRLDAGSVEGAVNVNCQVKILYGTTDADTAEWVARTSGTRRVFLAQLEKAETGAFGGEKWASDRSFREDEAPLISPNTVLAMQPRVAIALVPGHAARMLYPAWMPYTKTAWDEACAMHAQVAPLPVQKRKKAVPLPSDHNDHDMSSLPKKGETTPDESA